MHSVECQPPDGELAPWNDLWNNYWALRNFAEQVKKNDDPRLETVRSIVGQHLERRFPDWDKPGTVGDYAQHDQTAMEEKIGIVADLFSSERMRPFVSEKVVRAALDASSAFVACAFGMHKGEYKNNDGSFAFVVPMRVPRTKGHDEDYEKYRAELEPLVAITRYIPSKMLPWFMRTLPPFIADIYEADETGRRGYMICVPTVNERTLSDLSLAGTDRAQIQNLCRSQINEGVDLGVRQGVQVVGLGAIFPALTCYGKSVDKEFRQKGIVVTTGHGGTVVLIRDAIDKIIEERHSRGLDANEPPRFGILGLGSIGKAAGLIISKLYPESPIAVFDIEGKRIESFTRSIQEVERTGSCATCESEREVLKASDVVISAITAILDLRKIGVQTMRDKLIVDDSQPAAFDRGQVEGLGGTVVWPIGQAANFRRLDGYDFGHTIAGDGLFGCEAEAAALYDYMRRLAAHNVALPRVIAAARRFAIVGKPVTTRSAEGIRTLFERSGVSAAPFQSYGKFAIQPRSNNWAA